MKLFISACEPSSDAHAANLVETLKQELGDCDFFGIGGDHCRDKGMRIVVDTQELSVMGSTEALGKIPKLIRTLKHITTVVDEEIPDLAILLDYPEFHTRLAKRLKKMGVPTIYYVPPKVWVWRKHRLRMLHKLFTRIAYIFPFEKKFYDRLGYQAQYVGNPLLDELPITLTQGQARAELGLSEEACVITLMPGSRKAELNHHFNLFLDAALRVVQSLKGLGRLESLESAVLLIPCSGAGNENEMKARLTSWKETIRKQHPRLALPEIRLLPQGAHLALKASQAALIKSGTSTLEAALLGCPHAIVYKASRATKFIYKTFVRYKGPVGLSNLVAINDLDSKLRFTPQQWAFQEILLDQVTTSKLTQELLSLFTDEAKLEKQEAAFLRVLENLKPPSNVDWANMVKAAAHEKRLPEKPNWLATALTRFSYVLVSLLWSSLNAVIQFLVSLGALKPKDFEARVISVGNIQAGGTGKTPVVAFLAQEAIKRGLRVAILMRGYRSLWEDKGGVLYPKGLEQPEPVSSHVCGDEAALLKQLVPEAWIGVGRDRIKSYESILELSGRQVECVILDDGFQHWKINRDVEITLLTSKKWGSTYFRDFPWAVKRSRICLWTKGDVKPHSYGVPCVELNLESDLDRTKFREKHLWLVTGIADDQTLLSQLTKHQYVIDRHFKFEDHAAYNPKKVFSILDRAKAANATVAVTGKDFVKWRELGVKPDDVWILEPEIQFREGQLGKDALDKSIWG